MLKSNNLSLLLLTVLLVMSVLGIILLDKPLGKVYYDCSLSEISSDIPVAVKEQCRKERNK